MKDLSINGIRAMTPADWQDVQTIYLEGIATGNATFETEAPGWEKWDEKHLPFARLVAVTEDGGIGGWAAITPVSSRSAYAGVAEVSVYVASAYSGRGIGQKLLNELVRVSEKHGIWTLQASVFPENVASIAVHKRCGFREVGIRERIGKLGEKWRDTMLLERRSQVTGCDS